MKSIAQNAANQGKALAAVTVAALLLAACATAPVAPAGAADARAKLTQLQSNPDLSGRAPAAIKDAELAVRAAEEPQADPELGKYRVYIADRKVDIAIARARTAFAEDQRATLSAQRDKSRLDARTQEADASKSQLASARSEADSARMSADAATQQSADAQRQAADLQRQIDEMHAKPTDRGLVLTLGDVLFESAKADLKVGATANLNRLVAFLNSYPTRTVMIEGHTDSIGGEDYNMGLSQRRADSVKSYLLAQGIAAPRLSSAGKGKSQPIADNSSASGRQQNRRVEVIISNPVASN
jgi:outer membrane protein OmpA-like peptidoglycan-associated protein